MLPLVRRATSGLVVAPGDVADISQETAARLLAVRERLDADTLAGYAVVVARNLAVSDRRRLELERRHRHRLYDPPDPVSPEAAAVRLEEAAALWAALDRLPEEDRRLLLERHERQRPIGRMAAERGRSVGAVRVALSRARARARVEYLLTRRGGPVTPTCRPVLLALATGDSRRQSRLSAGRHLATCRVCAAVADPLLRHDRRLVGLLPWAGLAVAARQLRSVVRSHPGPVTATAAAAVAATTVAVVLLTGSSPPRRPPPPPPRRTPAPSTVAVAGKGLATPGVPDLAAHLGQPAVATAAPVLSVADEGLWVGDTPGGRVFVLLEGQGEPRPVHPGDTVDFRGRVRREPPGFPARIGLGRAQGAAQLVAERGYVAVGYDQIRVDPARHG